jgi:hypothetical protein
MVEWRDRGFVQDSDDDEDETIETQSTTRPEDKSLPGTQQRLADGDDGNVTFGLEKGLEVKAGGTQVEAEGGQKVEHIRQSEESSGNLEESSYCKRSGRRDQAEEDEFIHGSAALQRDRELEEDDVDELALDQPSPIQHNRRRAQLQSLPFVPEKSPVSDGLISSPPLNPDSTALSQIQSQHLGEQRSDGTHPVEPTSPLVRQHVEVRIPPRDPSLYMEELQRTGRQRNLRERKLIQLHPYDIERMRYEREMKSRGVKPVRIAMLSQPRRPPADHQQDEEEEESQPIMHSQSSAAEEDYVADGAASTPRYGSPRRSSPASVSSPPRPSASLGDDEDLPGLEELLKKRPLKEKTSQGGGKRRKVTYSAKRKTADVLRAAVVSDSPAGAIEFGDIFEFPDSSAPASPPRPGQARLRIPPPISPVRRSTHAASSNTKTQSARRSQNLSHNTPPAPVRTQKRTVIIQSPIHAPVEIDESSTSESEIDPAEEIRAVKKRIKGVLPASWLKLDLKARENRLREKESSPRRTGFQHEEEAEHRGVAKRSIRTGPRAKSSSIPILSDNDLDESDPEGPLPNFGPLSDDDTSVLPAPMPSVPMDSLFDDDPGDAMEDNSIDRMFPTTSRAQGTPKPGRKRHIKLKDAFNHSSKRLKTGEPSVYSTAPQPRTRTTTGHGPKRKRKPRPPKLSVLDVFEDDAASTAPNFLKIAARQARQHSDNGRQSPTNKHIRLQTRQDTEETTAVLQKWRSGSILPRTPKTHTSTQTRFPLGERSHNPRPEATERRSRHSSGRPRVAVRRQGGLQQTQLYPITRRHVTHAQGRVQSTPSRPKLKWKLPHTKSRPVHNAQLEMEEEEVPAPKGSLDFERGLRVREFDQLFQADAPSVISLANTRRKLKRTDSKAFATPLEGHSDVVPAQVFQKPTTPRRRLQRKREGHRVDIDTREYRQPEDFLPPSSHRSENNEVQSPDQVILQDLSPFGIPYTKDFDILPLPLGTHFHGSTFIGSGDFSRVLFMDHRNLDEDAGRHIVYFEDRSHYWGQWNEELSSSVHDIFQSISTQLGALDSVSDCTRQSELSHIAQVVQRVVKANADWLSFSDPIDRELCLSRFLEHLQPLQTATIGYLEAVGSDKSQPSNTSVLARLATLQIALLQQLLSMYDKNSSLQDTQKEATDNLKSLCAASLRYLTRVGFDDIRTFFEQNSRHSAREAGVKEDQVAVESLVVILHVLKEQRLHDYSFWDAFNTASLSSVATTTRVGTLERAWYNLFTVLPLAEFDSMGVLKIGQRFTESFDNWVSVKMALSRVFALYPATSTIAGNTINDYLRSLLIRCYRLIENWSWGKCETIIGAIFDFFASNNLAPLQKEETHGSPHFLENLNRSRSLEIGPEDRSFHIFLKIVATGLRGMRGIYPDKKIRGIAWRCVPNHGRTYRKDQELKQEDLDALRNHHDLLCTLYWASPLGFRLRVDMIQNLVDHTSSHREACRLSIKAWTNLARFQVSNGENSECVAPFAAWFKDIVEQTVNQFKLARIEAEAQFGAAKKDGDNGITQDVLDNTIARNQSHVASSLAEAIGGLRSVLTSATNFLLASELLRSSGVERVLTLFDPKNSRPNSAIIECLLTYQTYLALTKSNESSSLKDTSQQASEESQDYGDWPDLEGEEIVPVLKHSTIPLDFVFDPVAQLLSNCFGAEKSPDDSLLTAVVDLWANLAWSTVQRGQYGWESFLDDHGSHAWNQLRETEQRRKYGSYFLSRVSEHDSTVVDNRPLFVSALLSALVERDSQLKFQHHLTSVILNQLPGDELLCNLPFIQRSVNGAIKYEVTMGELRERRLGLISSILSNMHDHFNENSHLHSELRQEYTTYLKQLMSAMKTNYTALQHHGENVTGTYVVFVQRIVEFLQQYTFDICPVDKFFTDSIIFPLPANDPLYVVGKLKGYATKLADAKEVRRLAGFFQSVSERAAVDNEQEYLIDQLQKALLGDLKIRGPSLKAILIQEIFPAYLESSFTTEAGWIMAKPVLVACARTFDRFLYDFHVDDDFSVDAALGIMESLLAVLPRVIRDLGDRTELFQQPHALSTLSATLDVVTAIMPSIDYIYRRTGRGEAAIHSTLFFRSFSVFAAKMVMGIHDPFAPVLQGNEATAGPEHDEIKGFCARELHRDLGNWRLAEGRYSVKRGTMWREVMVSLGSIEEERNGLVHSIEEFHTVLARMKAFARYS